jgi:hypothetical protein
MKKSLQDVISRFVSGTSDKDIAETLCERMNEVIEAPEIRKVVPILLGTTVVITDPDPFSPFELRQGTYDDDQPCHRISTLGFINGLLGTYKIVAVYDSDRKIRRFRVDEK